MYARYEVQLGKMLDERQITKRFLAPYLRNTDVQWDGINVNDLPEMDFDDSEQELYALRPGDILMCEGGEIGRCAIWDSDRRCFYQKALHRLRPTTNKDDPRYFVLVMRAAVEAGLFSSRASAATIQHLPAEKLRVVRYPAPPIEEQRAIVDRVSRQTVRLDALVAAKQRLLDLLAEKRKAIIATAVSRGLDPKVKLRDSGVPWLGGLPAHWEIERARWLFRERDVRSTTGEEEMLTVSHLTGVTPRSEKDVNMFEAETNEGYKLCEPGDLVINTLWAWMGAMGIAPVKGIVSPAYNVYEPGPRLAPAYIDALVRLPVFAQEVTRYSKGVWSSRLRLYPEGFFEVYLPVPPQEEQRAIVEHIARETAKLDAVRAATERTIALLRERRSALIAAAVTGQLDVGAAT
ncbi:restriction endonuclease subunit S [Corallococcus sp. AS-1-6]|uniref:restriction endonuclease subunit S n=1 Tax=Corallococcus sp. AS-1-6 TaxID=2874599 RepID=UPI001CC0964D|nr:restriction endonuclease subunit S [Corallococcus sp. AS-1-6]